MTHIQASQGTMKVRIPTGAWLVEYKLDVVNDDIPVTIGLGHLSAYGTEVDTQNNYLSVKNGS